MHVVMVYYNIITFISGVIMFILTNIKWIQTVFNANYIRWCTPWATQCKQQVCVEHPLLCSSAPLVWTGRSRQSVGSDLVEATDLSCWTTLTRSTLPRSEKHTLMLFVIWNIKPSCCKSNSPFAKRCPLLLTFQTDVPDKSCIGI